MHMLDTVLGPRGLDFNCVLSSSNTYLSQVEIQATLEGNALTKHPRYGTDSNKSRKYKGREKNIVKCYMLC